MTLLFLMNLGFGASGAVPTAFNPAWTRPNATVGLTIDPR